jgi:hypothetical protein
MQKDVIPAEARLQMSPIIVGDRNPGVTNQTQTWIPASPASLKLRGAGAGMTNTKKRGLPRFLSLIFK